MNVDHAAEVRLLTIDEIDNVAGGRMIDIFRNQRALELVAKTEKWLAEVGAESLGGQQL